MRRTRDQRDLEEVLEFARDARGVAYDLFRRRYDTRRNVDSFILLRDALVRLERSCVLLERSVEKATELKSSDQNSVSEEIGVRSGRLRIEDEPQKTRGPASILPFRRK